MHACPCRCNSSVSFGRRLLLQGNHSVETSNCLKADIVGTRHAPAKEMKLPSRARAVKIAAPSFARPTSGTPQNRSTSRLQGSYQRLERPTRARKMTHLQTFRFLFPFPSSYLPVHVWPFTQQRTSCRHDDGKSKNTSVQGRRGTLQVQTPRSKRFMSPSSTVCIHPHHMLDLPSIQTAANPLPQSKTENAHSRPAPLEYSEKCIPSSRINPSIHPFPNRP